MGGEVVAVDCVEIELISTREGKKEKKYD